MEEQLPPLWSRSLLCTHQTNSGKPVGVSHTCPLPAKPRGPQSIPLQSVPMGLLGSVINRHVKGWASSSCSLSLSRAVWFSSECTLTWGQEAQSPDILRDPEDSITISWKEGEAPLSHPHPHGLRRNVPEHRMTVQKGKYEWIQQLHSDPKRSWGWVQTEVTLGRSPDNMGERLEVF